jgi:acylphosphatase
MVCWVRQEQGQGNSKVARRYVVRGRVQGVGFRYFVEHTADAIGVAGWVRNQDDGNVEVYAIGTPEQLNELEGQLWKGPRWSEVRGVDVREAAVDATRGFSTRH